MKRWRWIDTGTLRAAQNIALNRALLAARQAGEAPSTLRFLRFAPSALVGCHGNPGKEFDLAFCREHGIAVQRRITGGGAIYMDEGVLGWELYADKTEAGAAGMAALSARICGAAARALQALGVAARHRLPADLVVGERKISGTGGAMEGDSLIYQGTLLLDFDVERMLRVLGVRDETAYTAARRALLSLKEVLEPLPPPERIRDAFIAAFSAGFDARIEAGELNALERERLAAALEEIDTPQWIRE
jgi:lipoate---protein ligase